MKIRSTDKTAGGYSPLTRSRTKSSRRKFSSPDPLGSPKDRLTEPNKPDLKLIDPRELKNQTPPATQKILEELFHRSAKSPNPVLSSLEPCVKNASRVSLDYKKIREWAQKVTPRDVKPAEWRFPFHIEEDSQRTLDFFFLANSINYLFFDPENGEKFQTEYRGETYSGSDAMFASLKRAMEEGVPILDADYLSRIGEKEMKHIFRGNFELPLLKERTQSFREVGKVLKDKYQGHFLNLAREADFQAFDQGKGMVERIVKDFPSFRDESPYPQTGENLIFNKRAQLQVGMLHSRLEKTGIFACKDVKALTVFADYQLPKGLKAMGILKYSPELEKKIAEGELIPKDSLEEQEIRAFTIVASKLLEEEINRREGFSVDARGIDFLLWHTARKDNHTPHHRTVTTAY